MYSAFNELSPSSKIWIYQSDRELNSEELDYLNSELRSFSEGWAAHSQSLKTSYKIEHNYFIILSVDESINDASGCSIDSSVRIIKKVGEKIKVDFFKRENVAFLIDGKVKIVNLSSIKNEIENNEIDNSTLFFNNQLNTIQELKESWKVEAKTTWLNRYF